MSKDTKDHAGFYKSQKRPLLIIFIGFILTIILIVITVDISHRGISSFVTAQQKYILAIESTLLVFLVVEMLARLTMLRSKRTQLMMEHGTGLRLIIRVFGYTIGSLSVISIIASNSTLGISVGAIAGVVIAFATQNTVGNVLAAIMILTTRVVRAGEEITVGTIKGIVADINLTHTILSVDDEVIFVPNSLVMSSMIRRRKRNAGKGIGVDDW